MPPRKRWVKQWTQESLTGFPRSLEPDERSVWYDLRSLAGDSCNPGVVCAYPGVPYTDEQISRILNISLELFLRAKAKLMTAKDISINGEGSIIILEWEKHFSEYERQKPHRAPDFRQMRDYIKERDNYTCQVCDKHEDDLKVPLCVHYIDNDSSNNEEENLIAVCMSCRSHLLKKAVHKTKEAEQHEQAASLKQRVQQVGSTNSLTNKRFNGRPDQTEPDNTRPGRGTPPAGGARRQRATPDPRVKQILDKIREYCGYPDRVTEDPIPNPAKESTFVKKMLNRGFTLESVVGYWKRRINERGGEFISATWINEDIGKRSPGVRGELPTAEELAASWEKGG